jgi:hypothetical protein
MAARSISPSRLRAPLGIATLPRFATLTLIATLLLPLATASQPSPINITHRIGYDTVPTFARIHAAATSGASSLVVWGAADEVDEATIGRLYYQAVRASDSGRARLLVDTSFRPANAVAVAPISAGFIVVWGDGRADAPGVYTRRVALDGSLAGGPMRLHANSTALSSIETFVTGAGTTLVWSDSLGELFVHRFTRDGSTLIDRASLGRRAPGNARRLGGQPDLIEIPTAAGVMIVDGDNRIRQVSAKVSQRFSLPHTMLPDSSIAILRDSTVYLYRSAFSDEVLDSLTVPIPPSVLALSALGVSDDSVVVTYPVFTKRELGAKSVHIEFTGWTWGRGPDPQPPGGRVALVHDVYQGPTYRHDVGFRFATATRLCGNRTLITVVIEFSEWLSPGYSRHEESFHFLAWPSGVVTIESRFAVPTDDCQYDDTTRPFPRVVRTTGSRAVSAVTALGDTFSAPTRRFPRNVDELEPNVVIDQGRIIVTLRSAWKGSTIGFIPWDAAGLDSVHDAPTFIRTPGRTAQEVYRRIRGASVLERIESWPSSVPLTPPQGDHAVMAIGTDWPSLYETAGTWKGYRVALGLGVSANQREIASYYRVYGFTPVAITGPIRGPMHWKRDVSDGAHFEFVVHLDTGRVLLLQPRSNTGLFARLVGPAITTVDTYSVVDVDSVLAALPIEGDRYFLVSAQSGTGAIVVRELRVKGGTISSTSLPPLGSLRDAFFLIDPSDTSVAVIAVSNIGVQFARFARHSVVSPEWTTLVEGANLAQPSALFVGDTLYAAWSDTTSADADIFGIALHRSELPMNESPKPPEPGSFATSPVWPTPAQTRATLRMSLPETGRLAVHLFDTRGLLVRTIERDIATPGWFELTLDVSDLIDGVYELRASVGSRATHARISVVHDW